MGCPDAQGWVRVSLESLVPLNPSRPDNMTDPIFDPLPILKYLSLPIDHNPSPEKDPIAFLRQNIQNLPPGLLARFSINLTPRQRASIVTIKNRRTTWSSSYDGLKALGWQQARKEDPIAYEAHMIAASGTRGAPLATTIDPGAPQREVRRGEEEAEEERDWAENHFLGGASEYRKHVGDGKFAVSRPRITPSDTSTALTDGAETSRWV